MLSRAIRIGQLGAEFTKKSIPVYVKFWLLIFRVFVRNETVCQG